MGYTYTKGVFKMRFTKNQIIDITLIIISIISLITSFVLSLDYISWISIILCGMPIFKECIEGLVTEFDIKADLLVSIAIIASIIIGEVFAAGEIATIMAIGGFLEEYTVSKTQVKIKELAKMTPQFATRIRNGIEERIPVENVQVGDILKVLPGESIPTDGIIINGEASINQSTLTGDTAMGAIRDAMRGLGGSLCFALPLIMGWAGALCVLAARGCRPSTFRIICDAHLRIPMGSQIVRTADKWATLIVAIAFAASILTYLYTFEIIRSVTILVVFCPCALVLATPTAIMAAIGNLTKYGVLIKDGESLEELAHVDELIFDKTGTLTNGTPKVVNVTSDNPKEMMYLISSLESKSEHPLAKAIVQHYNSNELAEVDNFKIHIGEGVSGTINGSRIIAGNKKLLKSENVPLDAIAECQNGEIQIFVAKDAEYLGCVYLADTLRKNTGKTIRRLKGLRIKTTLLTGDNEKTAKYIAEKIKIRNVKFNCLPQDKTEYIAREQILGHKVAMIGDGINDAPSLKKANVGIAMGNIGSDISVDAANITLINDNIEDIPQLIAVARRSIKVISIGIAFALIVNIVAMALAILGLLNPIEGALIHNIGSVIVIIYSSTLVNYKISKRDCRNPQKLGVTKSLNKSMT